MPRKLSASVEARIVALRRAHKTEAQIATVLAREGVEITTSGVHRVLSRLGLAAPRKGSKPADATKPRILAPVPPPSAPTFGADAAGEGDEGEDVATRLRRVLASLERAATQAEADKDVARIVAAQKAITAAAALLAKVTPPPPVELDDRPDMRAAAQRGRDRIRTLIGRMLGGPT